VAPPQTPLGELTALPQTPYLDLRGPTSKGGEGKRRGWEVRGGEAMGREEGRGRSTCLPPRFDNPGYGLDFLGGTLRSPSARRFQNVQKRSYSTKVFGR